MEGNTRWDIGIAMSWFSIIKENRLVSENITHTKVNEQEPEQEDDKCKKALIKFVELMDAYLDALGSKYFEWRFDVDRCIEVIETFPERRCCRILEKMRGVKNQSNPESAGQLHYAFLKANDDAFAMMVEQKDHIERSINGETQPRNDLMFFVVVKGGGSAESRIGREYVNGSFRTGNLEKLKKEPDSVIFEEIEGTWKRVFDTIMGMIP